MPGTSRESTSSICCSGSAARTIPITGSSWSTRCSSCCRAIRRASRTAWRAGACWMSCWSSLPRIAIPTGSSATRALFCEVCDLFGRTAAQHHDELVKRFIEQPAAKLGEEQSQGLTASGPPLPVLLRSLEVLRDLRLAADRPISQPGIGLREAACGGGGAMSDGRSVSRAQGAHREHPRRAAHDRGPRWLSHRGPSSLRCDSDGTLWSSRTRSPKASQRMTCVRALVIPSLPGRSTSSSRGMRASA